jgi:alkylation response protein AidB-like acyl-CoA dehydrogenase
MESTEKLLAFASEWSKKLPGYSAQFEKERRLSTEICAHFAQAGVFNMLVPEEYGGLEMHPRDFVQVLKLLSMGDGSAGWNAMIGGTTGVLSASLPDEFAREIYGKPGVLTVGVTAPVGRADIVEGGYRVSGRWPFGSGSQNADWICGGCFIYDNNDQVIGKYGPESQLMMFEANQVNIEDTWHVAGLKGTGSHHFNVENQFVPKGRSVILGARARVQRPLYQFPLLGLLALGVSSVSLGLGYKALNAFKDLAGVKSPTGSKRKLIDRPAVQADVAKSIADLESAEAYINHVIDSAWSAASQGEKLSLAHKGKLRLAAVNATHQSVLAVDRLYKLGGGSSIYESSELQQCFRDIHVTTQHIMVASPIFEVAGKVELGIDPRQPI